MTIRVFIATATICCTTLTGCASKQAVKIDSSAPTSASPTTTAPPAVIAEKTDDGLLAGSAIGENIPLAESAAEQTNDLQTDLHLDTVYFGFDSYLLRTDARNILTGNARWLNENQRARVIIEGHADERGSDEYNLALAEKRAIAAKRYIEALGVNPDRMEAISYGENKPAMEGHDEETLAKNRRVEFVIAK